MTLTHKKQHWWLVRHAPVKAVGIYGQLDVDADLSCEKTFQWLGASLPDDFSVVSSDLSRCHKTATKILKTTKGAPVTVKTHTGFREQHFGDWQGLTYQQAEEMDKGAYEHFWAAPAENKPSGGESFSETVQRVCATRSEISNEMVGGDILLVAHAGTIRALVSEALNISPAHALALVVDPLSLTRLTYYQWVGGESWQVDWINRVAPD